MAGWLAGSVEGEAEKLGEARGARERRSAPSVIGARGNAV